MNYHTKEFLMDCLSLLATVFLALLITYLVFWKDVSGWWYLLLLFKGSARFTPSELSKK